MPLDRKQASGGIIEIIRSLTESLDYNLKAAQKTLLEKTNITNKEISYIKYLINTIYNNIEIKLILDRCLKNVGNQGDHEGRLSSEHGRCIKTDTIINYYASFKLLLNNIKNQLYIYSLKFDSIIGNDNIIATDNTLLLEFCYTIYTTLNNLYININKLENKISDLETRETENFYSYLYHVFGITMGKDFNITIYKVVNEDNTKITGDVITYTMPTIAGSDQCVSIDELDKSRGDIACDPLFYPIKKLLGGNSNYKKTNDKVEFTYKNKKYNRVIYINAKNKKYVRLNNEYLLLSKLQKNK
jgi:hypothetical protein